jgi:hypothetical protein
MKWSDIQFKPPANIVRQFAGGWLVFIGALGAHQWLARGHERVGQMMIAAALVIGLLGLIKPAAIRWLFVAAMVVAFPIGWVVSHLLLAIMFYLVLTPVALFFRLRGRDLLHRKRSPGQASFWKEKITPQEARSYFLQY